MGFLRIAHRGASGTRPELTRVAFERAIEIGVDLIELDVQLTRDGELVVVHDRKLGRTLPGTGLVRDFTLDALCALDAGSWFDRGFAAARCLSLAEVLEITAGHCDLNVEIKSPPQDFAATAAALCRLLIEKERVAGTIVSCFDMDALAAVRRVNDDVQIGVLWMDSDTSAGWSAARDLCAATFHPCWAIVDSALIDTAHARDLRVLVWTVNEVEMMQHLLRCGADGLMSDFPERFTQVFP